ncbi:hypothetical protein ANMWB30_34820 [Arthrobacter sp. MWB30]|nr:hypothetical protein ANMWB30_34820 [Arthrobacter sp. MWB30]
MGHAFTLSFGFDSLEEAPKPTACGPESDEEHRGPTRHTAGTPAGDV